MRKTVRTAACAAFLGISAQSFANPTGADVVAGSAAISGDGDLLSVITQSDRTIINWDSFSIGAHEVTNFLQPGTNSAVLNRVIGNSSSDILGSLLSNGHVALINQNGILIGESGVIDTQGFLASTLDISNADFIGGTNLTFQGDSEAALTNKGLVVAREGDVFLIGQMVSNEGTIKATDGDVALAAGSTVTLKKAGDGRLSVSVPVSKKGASASNTGTIAAAQKRLRDAGGNPYMLGMNVDRRAAATGVVFRGGKVVLTSGTDGTTTQAGNIAASKGDWGGEIEVAGKAVIVEETSVIEASGPRGGGRVKIGGGYQGLEPLISNAWVTMVKEGAQIRADATESGDGGEVIVWADGGTLYEGEISAKGGKYGGNGGFAEVSGKQYLDFNGSVDLTASLGLTGTLLLDPDIINIIDDPLTADVNGDAVLGDDVVGDIAAGDFAGLTSVLSDDGIEAILAVADLSLAATTEINVDAPIDWNSGQSLTLTSGSDVNVNAAITNAAAGNIVLQGDRDVTISAPVTTAGTLSVLFGQGGAGTATIDANISGTVAATVTGGAADDTVAFSVLPASATVDGAGGTNTLVGTNASEDWAITGMNTGTLQSVQFSNFANLKSGGTAIDTFDFGNAATNVVTGLISGADVTDGNLSGLIFENDGIVTDLSSAVIRASELTLDGDNESTFVLGNPSNSLELGFVDGVSILAGTRGATIANDGDLRILSVAATEALDLRSSGRLIVPAMSLTGDLALTADDLSISGAGDIEVGGVLSVTSVPGTSITLGTGADFNLNNATLDRFEAAQLVVSTPGAGDTITLEGTNIPGGPDGISGLVTLNAGLAAGDEVIFDGVPDIVIGAGGLMVTAGPSTISIGTDLSVSGPITFATNVEIGGDLSITSTTNDTIDFQSTVNGDASGRDLSVNTTGSTIFGGVIGGGANPLASLTTNLGGTTDLSGNVTVANSVAFNDDVNLTGNVTVTSTNNDAVSFGGTVNGAQELIVNTTGATTFGAAIGGGTALASLTTNAGGATSLAGNVTAADAVNFNDDVNLTGNVTVTSTNNDAVSFGGTVNGAQELIVNTTGATTFGAAIGGGTALASLTTNIGGATSLAGNVTAADAVNFNDDVNLTGNVTVLSTNNDAVSFGGTVNGAQALQANTTGATTFGGAVGGATALTSLTTNAGGATSLAGNVTAADAVNFNDDVNLTGNVTVTSTNNDAVSFGGTVNGAQELIVNTTGATTFGAAIGGGTALTSLTTNVGGATSLAGNVTAADAVNFNDDVNLTGNVTVLSTNNDAVSFGGTVNGAQELIVNTTGATTFGAAIGGGTALASLTTNIGGATSLAGNVTAADAVNFNDDVNLTGDVTVLSTNNDAVSFGGTVNGAQALQVNTTGATTFGGAVGGATALTSLTTNAGGTTQIDGASVTTSGDQIYGDTVIAPGALALTSTAGSITAASPGNDFGGSTALSAVTGNATVVDTNALELGAVTTGMNFTATAAGDITGSDPISVGQLGDFTSNGGSITLNGPVNPGTTGTFSAATTTFGGTLSPNGDAALGVVNVTGDLAFGAGASLFLNLDGLLAAEVDLVTATGNVALANLALAGDATHSYSVSDTVTVMSAGGALNDAAPAPFAAGSQNFTPSVAGLNLILTRTASTFEWTGVTDGDWNDGTNWDAGGIVVPGEGDNLVFPNTATTFLTNNDLLMEVGSIAFNGAGGMPYDLGGEAITLGGGIDNDTTLTHTLSFATSGITLGAAQTFDAGTGGLIFDTLVDGAFDLTAMGASTIVFNQALGGTTPLSSVTVDAATTATLGANVTTVGNQLYSGTVIAPNAITLNANNALATAGGGDITANNPANDFQAALSVVGQNVSLADANALVVEGAAGGDLTTATPAGATTFGTTGVDGNLTASSSGQLDQTGTLTVDGTTTLNSGASNIVLTDVSNTLTRSGGLYWRGCLDHGLGCEPDDRKYRDRKSCPRIRWNHRTDRSPHGGRNE